MNRSRTHLALLALLVSCSLPTLATAATITVGPGGDYSNLFDAVANAGPNDTVEVANGSYAHTATLTLAQPITIRGASQAGVVLQMATTGWGINVAASDVTLERFTIQVVNPANQGYPIHAHGGVPEIANLTIADVTVQGATAGTQRRSGVDINRVDNVVLDGVTSTGATWGVGIAISGCVGVIMTDVVTAGNVWGGIGIYCTDDPAGEPARGSDNVTIVSATNSEPLPIYREDEFGVVNTNITLPAAYQHVVRNEAHRPDGDEFYFYRTNLADAVAAALAFTGFEADSYIFELHQPTHFWVGAAGGQTMSIQTAVDEGGAGSWIHVTAGTFVEQVVVGADLTLQGAATNSTIIRSPASLTASYTVGSNTYYPVVLAQDAATVSVLDLTVDGAGLGNANNRFVGLGFRNAGGAAADLKVTGVRHTPLNGVQGGVGIHVQNDDGTARVIAVTDCVVDDFQKNGITVNAAAGTPLDASILRNTVTGAGVLSADDGMPAQNGIQVSGADVVGLIEGNTVSGIAYDNTNAPTPWVATSILDFYTSVDVVDNVVFNGHMGVYKYSAAGLVALNELTIDKVGLEAYGIIATDPPQAVPSPVEVPLDGPRTPRKSVVSVSVDDNTLILTGTDTADTYGIFAYAGVTPDDLDISITGNTVSNFQYSTVLYQYTSDTGVFTSAVVNGNNLLGGDYALFTNIDAFAVDASCNWYGDVSGPDAPGNPNPGRPAIVGDVIFTPWLDGTVPGGACVLYGDNNVSVSDGPDCLTDGTTCTEVVVTFNRADTEASRGVSTTFQLSPELELCGPLGASVTMASGAGAWLDGYANTTMQLYDNGGGSYTVDLAVLGVPCGPTTGGDLYTISVKRAAGVAGDATGTVSVTAVTVRDCANAPLPGLPGAPGEVNIDQSVPGALADLTATQVKSGNDSDGTTEIALSWTAPSGDADYVEIWRKGFGDYPEYDDGTGAAPAVPVDAGNGWTLVATVDTADPPAYTDEPASRDFWTYAAYVVDGCGNASPVSDLTDGTLNYHLGDVTDGMVNGNGDNLVTTSDLSLLGANYGATLAPYGDPLNFVDVGPTTDFSVDARPTTDNRLQFEDLMIFALNYNQVSKRFDAPAPAAANVLALRAGPEAPVGGTLDVAVHLTADGTVQGLSIPLVWDAAVVQPLGVRGGELLAAQGGAALVLSPQPGVVDVALMGVRDRGLSGEGVVAYVSFRVLASGDPGIGLGDLDARDAENAAVVVQAASDSLPPVTPDASLIIGNMPNPFNPSTELSFAVGRSGPVQVRIYSLRGQLVRTLVEERLEAGLHSAQWNGADDRGRSVASGSYVVRLVAPDGADSRTITLVK